MSIVTEESSLPANPSMATESGGESTPYENNTLLHDGLGRISCVQN